MVCEPQGPAVELFEPGQRPAGRPGKGGRSRRAHVEPDEFVSPRPSLWTKAIAGYWTGDVAQAIGWFGGGRGSPLGRLSRPPRQGEPLVLEARSDEPHPVASGGLSRTARPDCRYAWKPALGSRRPGLVQAGQRRSALVTWGRPFRAPRLGSASSRGQRDNHERRLAPERRRTAMARKVRCRLGKHRWRSRGRGDALTYFCEVCGKTRDKPPRRSGGAEAPWWPGTG